MSHMGEMNVAMAPPGRKIPHLFTAEGYLRIIPRYRAYSTIRPNANMARSGVG